MSFASGILGGIRGVVGGIRHAAPPGPRYTGIRHVFTSYHPPSRSYSSGGGGGVRGVSSGVRSIRRAVRQIPPPPVHSALQAPSIFQSRLGPVGFQPFQTAATNAVESAVHALPGRVRAPLFPQVAHPRPAAQHYIDVRTQRYARQAAQERGYRPQGQGMGPLERTLMRSDPQARQALHTYFRGGTAGTAAAHDFRRQTMGVARSQGINAATGGVVAPQGGSPLGPVARHQGRVSVDYGPPGVRGWNSDPRALQALTTALRGGSQAVQARLGNVANAQYKQAASVNAYSPVVQHIAEKNHPSVVSQGLNFAFGPQHNALAAVTSGLYNHSALFRDAANLPSNTVSTAYNLGAAGFEGLTQGNWKRAGQIATGLREHDPLVLAVRALLPGVGTAGHVPLSRALYEARTHPVSTLLELSGAAHGLARGAELASRSTLPRSLAQDVRSVSVPTGRFGRVRGSLRGPLGRGVPYTAPGTGLEGFRQFSNHAAARLVQRGRATQNMQRANVMRDQAARVVTQAEKVRAGGDHLAADQMVHNAAALVQRANRLDPRIATDHQVLTLLDEHHSAMESLRRSGRGRVMAAAKAATHSDYPGIQQLFQHGIVDLSKSSLRAYLANLNEHALRFQRDGGAGTDFAARLHANSLVRKELVRAIKDPNFDARGIRMKAEQYKQVVEPLRKELIRQGMLDPAAAERAPLFGYAVNHMGARYAEVDGKPQLLDHQGNPLSNEQIKAHMQDPALGNAHINPADVIYLPQSPTSRGAVNYFRDWANRQSHSVGARARTGTAAREGTIDIHPDVLTAHAANLQGLLDANRGFSDFYRQFGFTGHEKARGTYADVQQAAADIRAKTGRELMPIRTKPWGGREQQMQALLDHAGQVHYDETGAPTTSVQQAVLDALNPTPTAAETASEAKSFGLADAAAVRQMQAHTKLVDPSTGRRIAQLINQGFRRTVLPFSVRWLFGNISEATVRTLLHAHFNPVAIASDYTLMRRAMTLHDRMLDGEVKRGALSPFDAQRAKDEMRARITGGGHYAMQGRTMLHRTAEQFNTPNTGRVVKTLAKVAGTAGQTWPVHTVLAVLRHWSDWVMNSVNGRAEEQFQIAQAGRAARLNLIDRRMPTVQHQAVLDLANGLRGTKAQVELGRMVDEAYGKYSKFGPTLRNWTATVTPFIPWTLNAIRFLTHTLPADHPLVTALAAANVNAQRDWIAANGMDPTSPLLRKNPWLATTYPLAGGDHMPTSRYTPFGLLQNFPGGLAGLVLPQYDGLLKGIQGQDWKGAQVPGATTWDKRLLLGAEQFLTTNVPVLGQAASISQRKEPSLGGKILGYLNPVAPYKAHQGSGAALSPLDKKLNGVSSKLGPVGGAKNLDQKLNDVTKKLNGAKPPGGSEGFPGRLAPKDLQRYVADVFGGRGQTIPKTVGQLGKPQGKQYVTPSNVADIVASSLSSGGLAQQALTKAFGGPPKAPAVAPGAPGSVVPPSVQLKQFAKSGVKAPGGFIPAGQARRQIQSLSALGYGHGQIVSHLQSGTKLKALGVPAALHRAMVVLNGAKSGFAPGSQKAITVAAARKYGVDPKILWGMYGNETNFGNNLNTSSTGAQGYMQFEPGTARTYGVNVNSFRSSMYGAAHYIHDLLKQHGNYPAALNGYSGGAAGYYQGAVQKGAQLGPIVKLNPQQQQAMKVAQRAALAWQNVGSGGAGPVRAGIFANPGNYAGPDRGIDYRGAGPVAAFAPGQVTFVKGQNSNTGWPGAAGPGTGSLMGVKLDRPVTVNGTTYKYMYYAENTDPTVRQGQHVRAGQTIAKARGSYPYTEQGFAGDANANTYASQHGQNRDSQAGRDFLAWSQSKAGKAAANRKGGLRMSQLPHPVQRFLKAHLPAPPASSGGSSTGVGGSASSGGSSSGGASGGSSGGANSPAGIQAILKALQSQPVPVSSSLTAPWFASGPVLAQSGPVKRKKSYI